MKNVYLASVCHGGVLGGALHIEPSLVRFCTGKLTIDPEYRSLRMPFADIDCAVPISAWLPLVDIRMKNGRNFRFLVFARRSFLRRLNQLISC